MNTNLWWAKQKPDYRTENYLRAIRLWEFLENGHNPALYKDIRRELGLSYWQTIRAVALLCDVGAIEVTVTAKWNGCHYIYPHSVRSINPPSL